MGKQIVFRQNDQLIAALRNVGVSHNANRVPISVPYVRFTQWPNETTVAWCDIGRANITESLPQTRLGDGHRLPDEVELTGNLPTEEGYHTLIGEVSTNGRIAFNVTEAIPTP